MIHNIPDIPSELKVLLFSAKDCLVVRVADPAMLQGSKFAFYLLLDGKRVATRWYTENPEARFARPIADGKYQAIAFIRTTGREGTLKGRSTVLSISSKIEELPPQSLADAPPVVLHIGLPKTGTTYLQRTFNRAAKDFRGFPIEYPDTGFYNHQIPLYEPLGAYLPWKPKPGSETLWQRLNTRLRSAGDKKMLLSAEALAALDSRGVAAFRSLLCGRRIERIVITTRSLVSLLPSHWQQNMKQGGYGTLDRYADRILGAIAARRSPSQMFNVAHTAQIWRDAFPGIPISVLEMDGGQKQNLLAFADLCGVGDKYDQQLLESVPSASEQNLSFSIEECGQLIEINEAIANGELAVNARKQAIAAFFAAREHGEIYQKPVLEQSRAEAAREVDRKSRIEINALPGCEWVNGKAQRQP